MDPSLQGGWRCVFDREVPLELRYQETRDGPQDVGTLEAIKVKVLALGSDNDPEALRIELSSETDLFFHYTHTVDEAGFRIMQEQQKLMVEFEDYTKVLTRMLNSCIKEPNTHLAIFVLQEDGPSRLDFIKNMEYKFVELLTCDFTRSSEDLVRQHIAYRYNAMKSRLALMQARLSDVNSLVKLKNPSLLLQIRRGSNANGHASSAHLRK
ncbi:Spindle assembly abnormal protein 6-like [Hondaea fermentalgiana]|uniref:Spindle assembly abnormal protein 6-like n=1 Tax=Hondaea fermentalgiana TaxID=2315210 RepID=A0A2R5GE98_9STRA|nr:Spindle assembly abnormal protein 6-like [Hondaea fermentalgiana]|eukprot:GBG26134.1 Spindle assembly abnormal protein 6-like [Hondaea fermentalgiana]